MEFFKGTVEDLMGKDGEQIAQEMLDQAQGFDIKKQEVDAWRRSIPFVIRAVEEAGIQKCGIILEYKLNFSSYRIDCILTGYNLRNEPVVLIIELKQWSQVMKTDTWNFFKIKGLEDEQLHPGIQALGYQYLLKKYHSAFICDKQTKILSCVYLHNFDQDNHVFDIPQNKKSNFEDGPFIFSKSNIHEFINFLKDQLGNGHGLTIADKIHSGEFQVSKDVFETLEKNLNLDEKFYLIGEQCTAFNRILNAVRKRVPNKKIRNVFIIKGEPGTGKTVIALRLLVKIQKNKHLKNKIAFTTPAKSFRAYINDVAKQPDLCKFVYRIADDAEKNPGELALMICDEAHRIPKRTKENICVVEKVIKASQTCVFLLDEKQRIKPMENGTEAFILSRIEAIKNQYDEVNVSVIDLEEQFRCNGSKEYLNMIEEILGMKENNNLGNKKVNFEFRVFDTPHQMEKALIERKNEINNQGKYPTARMLAGFCWEWHQKNDPRDEIVITCDNEIWKKRWNYNANSSKKQDEEYVQWKKSEEGFNQVGCVYTCQGTEFDYVGVIFGKDLIYRGKWQVDLDANKDTYIWNKSSTQVKKLSEEEILEFFKNIYRILLTRGSKGCYVYFDDEQTRTYFQECLKQYAFNH